ncbi:MAG TPA: FAD-dependent oxidoreductase [Pseudomonadales bacterium]
MNVEEHVDIVRRVLEEDIIDYLSVSHGSAQNGHKIIGAMHEPIGYELPCSREITRLTSLPTIVTGRFVTLEEADRVIAAGDADLVGMTRAHIADPDLVRKTIEGRAAEVRPCVACNQGCVGGLTRGRVGCAVNPAAGRERTASEERLERVATPHRVLVVGGGAAGMEAARIAALRGHEVTLAEAGERLGGMLSVARLAPHHESIGAIADWLEREIVRLGVRVLRGTRVTGQRLGEFAPDAVILATGATSVTDGRIAARPEHVTEGIDQAHVISVAALLAGAHRVGGSTALVLDDVGRYEAIGATELLVEHDVDVTLVTPYDVFAPEMVAIGVARPALERLTASGRFRLVTGGFVKRIGAGDAVLGSLGAWPDLTVPASTVVWVGRGRPNEALVADAARLGIPTIRVGDAETSTGLPTAIASGHDAGRRV